MNSRIIKKGTFLTILIAFILTNNIYAAEEGSRQLFKRKKVDYQKLSTERQNQLEKKKAVFKEGDENKDKRRKQAQRILQSHLKDISEIHIPAEVGRVIEVYKAPSSDAKLIVHIQDLHTNPEGQYNLANILEMLVKNYNLELVCSEGAEGEVDTSSVSSFPDAEVREKTAKLFVDSGELTGEEYLSITKYPDLPIWGIEDKDIYFKNIIQFNKIMKFSPKSQVFISQAKQGLELLKPKIYTSELLNLDKKENEFENNEIKTNEYLEELSGYIQQFNIPFTKYKNISLLNETMQKEKTIDQQKIMKESQALLMNLQTDLTGKKSKHDMDNLMAKAELFKKEKISPFSFYSYLKELSDRHLKDSATKYPALYDFVDYLTKVNLLDITALFNEMEELAFDVKLQFARTQEQKTLINALRNIKFLEGFFNLKVSNEELNYYLDNKDSHKIAFFESFLKPTLKKYGLSSFVDYNPDLIDMYLEEIEHFYETVKERDEAMYKNTTSEIKKRNAKVAALISGGFHTEGVTRMLRETGYSYIVVSPFSDTEIDEENYHYLLSGKRKPISELLEELGTPETAKETSSK